MKSLLMSLALAVVAVAAPAFADNVPGFEDEAVYNDVMKGTIRVEEVLGNNVESTFVVRGYFAHTSPDLYVDVATNHKEYPQWFSEIKEAKTTSVNAERTEWTYWMHMAIKVLLFTEHIYPEGRQVYSRPADAISEGVLTHTLNNYSDSIKSMLERTRLIPHQDGILVHDYINYVLVKPNSNAALIRSKLKEQFVRFMKAYRKAANGNW